MKTSNAATPPIAVELDRPLPAKLVVGRGQYLVVSGTVTAASLAVTSVSLSLESKRVEAELSLTQDGVTFWQAIPFDETLGASRVSVGLAVRLSSGVERLESLGEIECLKTDWTPLTDSYFTSSNEPVAICMATYDPGRDAFKRQIDSIREQTHRNWVCIVNDDGTPQTRWLEMEKICEGDARFVLNRNEQNLGFYRNFERSLKSVPREAEFVALSDQDDYWYPDKLRRLLLEMRAPEVTLVYSDMRIVNAEGRELSNTYWTNRKNEYQDFQAVLVANTVTGAASLFRRSVLDDLVPFPPRVGDAFHDHWLACVCLSRGGVAYVDTPLYDYYQYGTSVIGHCDFVPFSFTQRVTALFRFLGRMCMPSVAKPYLKQKYGSALAVYRGECRRLRLVEGTLNLRVRGGHGQRPKTTLFNGGIGTVFKLLWLHAKVLANKQTTDDAELRLAMGEFARVVEGRHLRRQLVSD